LFVVARWASPGKRAEVVPLRYNCLGGTAKTPASGAGMIARASAGRPIDSVPGE